MSSLYGEGWAKRVDHMEGSSESLAFIPFLLCLDPLKIQFRSGFPLPRPQQNPSLCVSLNSTGPGGNVSLLWLHI